MLIKYDMDLALKIWGESCMAFAWEGDALYQETMGFTQQNGGLGRLGI